MFGLLINGMAIVWILIAMAIGQRVTRSMANPRRRNVACLLVFLALLPLPLIDEIVDKSNFEELCRRNSSVVVEGSNLSGRKVQLGVPDNSTIHLTFITVYSSRWNYVDAENGTPIYHYYNYNASGGWISRALQLSPLLFEKTCQPSEVSNIKSRLGLITVNRADTSRGADRANHQ